MKKIFLFLVILLLLGNFVLAEQQSTPNSGTGADQEQQTQLETQNNGDEQTITVQQRARNSEELSQMIQQRQRQMNQEIQGLEENKQNIYQNQNRVRLAVHSLLAMEDLAGGVGPQVREIARNLNNSAQATIRAEEKIQTRSRFIKFFAGGDKKAAEELEIEVTQNQQRIQELKQLREQCDCGEEVKVMMREQIQNIEQEQQRIQELAQKEKKNKGLFGWIWK